MRLRQLGKPLRLALQVRVDGSGALARRRERRRIVAPRGDQDVGSLVEVGGAEARAVALVVAPTSVFVRLPASSLARSMKAADQRLLVRLAPALGIGQRIGAQAATARLLQQQLAHRQRAGGGPPGVDRAWRRGGSAPRARWHRARWPRR